MPITKSAKKALRQNKRRKSQNDARKNAYKNALRLFKKTPTAETLSAAYKKLDKAAKTHVIHYNKAGRLKSRLAHRIAKSKSAIS